MRAGRLVRQRPRNPHSNTAPAGQQPATPSRPMQQSVRHRADRCLTPVPVTQALDRFAPRAATGWPNWTRSRSWQTRCADEHRLRGRSSRHVGADLLAADGQDEVCQTAAPRNCAVEPVVVHDHAELASGTCLLVRRGATARPQSVQLVRSLSRYLFAPGGGSIGPVGSSLQAPLDDFACRSAATACSEP